MTNELKDASNDYVDGLNDMFATSNTAGTKDQTALTTTTVHVHQKFQSLHAQRFTVNGISKWTQSGKCLPDVIFPAFG